MTRKIHFLNVKNGDCTIYQRDNIFSVIDICCGNIEMNEECIRNADYLAEASEESKRFRGNFNMKATPTNPIEYLKRLGVKSIFRFILSHPDMDHMDGIKSLFEEFEVANFWDNGIRRDKPNFGKGPYFEEDWDFYEKLINKKIDSVTVVTPLAGSSGKYWNQGDDGLRKSGHYLDIFAPTKELVEQANDSGEINDGSYVLKYAHDLGGVLICGDSEDATWDHILSNHSKSVENTFLLIAPHHGRDSNRDWRFLDVVKPKVTLIGNARSEHINYDNYRKASEYTITNNQAGNIVVEFDNTVKIYVENETYANNYNLHQRVGDMYLILEYEKVAPDNS